MKYIKKFENINDPEIGQYALSINNKLWKGKNAYKEYDEYINFINNNIGKIIDKVDNFGIKVYLIKYDNMPTNIDTWLKKHGSRDDLFKTKNDYQKNTTRFTSNDNNFFSADTIEELKLKINTNKYNL